MSNIGVYGFPAPTVDQNTPVIVGPAWRDPTARFNWPSNPVTLFAVGATPNLYEVSPAGNTVLPCALEWSVFLRAGTWAAAVRVVLATNAGITGFWLDGMSLGTFDEYASGGNTYALGLANTVPVGEGFHTLRVGKTGTKNGSSSDYYANVIDVTLRRTG